MGQARRTVNVDRVLDDSPFGGLSLSVTICAAAILVLDGFDIQIIGFAAPALVTELGIERAELAPALASSLVGMAVGAAAIGALGDRWGRRPTLLLSTSLFGLSTLFAVTASSVEALAAWRFVRLGGILSSVVGGILLAYAGAAGFFAGIGAVLLLTFTTVLLVRRHIAHRQLVPEDIDRGGN
jgi:MFS transporter, AAHS family, 4-hydroxybenzoate transporter